MKKETLQENRYEKTDLFDNKEKLSPIASSTTDLILNLLDGVSLEDDRDVITAAIEALVKMSLESGYSLGYVAGMNEAQALLK